MSAVTLASVRKVYPGQNARDAPVVALDDVSFSIAKHEFCSILGHSGCGKTTLLMMLASFERPSGGGDPCRRRARWAADVATYDCQRACDRHSLFHPARKLMQIAPLKAVQPYQRHVAQDDLCRTASGTFFISRPKEMFCPTVIQRVFLKDDSGWTNAQHLQAFLGGRLWSSAGRMRVMTSLGAA